MNLKLYGPTTLVSQIDPFSSLNDNQGATTMKMRTLALTAAALLVATLAATPAGAEADDAPIAAADDAALQAQPLPAVTAADAAPVLNADDVDLPLGMGAPMPALFDAGTDGASDAAGGAGIQAVAVVDWKFRTLNAYSDKCLDLAMNGTYRLYQHACNGGRNQQWLFEPTTTVAPNGYPYYRIRSEWGGMCVTATASQVYVATCGTSTYQQFAVEPGFYSKTGLTARVKARAIGRYLRVDTTAEANLITDANPNVVSAGWQVIP